MITTPRLRLRIPEPADRPALVAMLSDPEVMAALVRDPTTERAEASLARHDGYRAEHGLGFWLVECEGRFAGFCGLKPGADQTPIAGELEIGWLFDRPWWGKGLASEAAGACLEWAWRHRHESRVVAITATSHVAIRAVMTRIGMHRLPGLDFDHPGYATDDAMRRSVVYAVTRP